MNWSAGAIADVPLGVMTVTTTMDPDSTAGEVAVIEVAVLTVYEVAGVPPKYTLVAPSRFVPVMVTEVPPPSGPVFGLSLVTDGGPS